MIDALPLLLGSDEYQISRSVRLRSSASAYFNRTPASAASNGQRWTYSGWVKRGALGAVASLLSADAGGGTSGGLYFDTDNTLKFGTGATLHKTSAAVFRDPSAWYHIVVVADSTQATGANRLLLYVNGVPQTWTSGTDPTLNGIWLIGKQSTLQGIGFAVGSAASTYFDGYLTEINFIDGQSLPAGLSNWAQAFGETDIATGVWKPKKYTGTYGNNGFYLNFSDPSAATAAAIGKDYSGNGNNFTPNNITLSPTTSASYDSMLDVPTPWADGGNGRGNYCVLNPLDTGASATVSGGNLNLTYNAVAWRLSRGTIGLSTGQWYWEGTLTAGGTANSTSIGIVGSLSSLTNYVGSGSDGYGYLQSGVKYNNGTNTAYAASFTTNDVIGVALDLNAGTLVFYKNGVSQGTAFSGLSGVFFPAFDAYNNSAWNANFGQRPFAYTPPSGFRALNTLNLPTPTIANGANYFAATTYTGTGASRSVDNTVNNVSFQPDFVWVKGRSGATDHALYDAVRGVQKQIESNTTTAETTETTGLTAFNSNGFTVGALAQMNTNTATYVAWQWKEGATQGFDIVTYTGNSTASRSINHSLGVTPSMIFVKNRTTAQNNPVAHTSLAVGNLLLFDTTGASTAAGTRLRLGNSTAFTVGDAADYTITNQTGNDYVAYCFAAIAGFSRFGSYTGNGSTDGPFVFCGFRPAFVMIKKTTTGAGDTNWVIQDTARDTYNQTRFKLYPSSSVAENGIGGETTTTNAMDILSNGFKLRSTSGATNESAGTFIFAAFAENPFKYSLAR